jgi:hypothetical protein
MRAGRETRPSTRAVFAVAAAVLWIAAMAPAVAAHVNRTVGPYALLVVLIEEPVYQDNHAGFQFWVRKDGVPITGLERTLHARATGHGASLDLEIPPLDGLGFYVLDRSVDGVAFDPLGGGPWTLELTGAIEQTPVDVTFPVVFPAYPRVGVAGPQSVGAQAVAEQGSGWLPWALPVAIVGLGLTLALGAQLRRGRLRTAMSDHSHNS